MFSSNDDQLYGPESFLSAEEKREYDEKVEKEITQFNIQMTEDGVLSQPVDDWLRIRKRLFSEMVANRPKPVKVRRAGYYRGLSIFGQFQIINCLEKVWPCSCAYLQIRNYICLNDFENNQVCGSEKKLHEESSPSTSEDSFKLPGPSAPKRKKLLPPAIAANVKRKRTQLDEEYEAFLKKDKDWAAWWRFDCPEEEERFERLRDDAFHHFYASWAYESQPRHQDIWEVEKKVYDEIVANRRNSQLTLK